MAKRAADRPSAAQTVRAYIDQHPVVQDALRMGIVNLSALTRRIMDATGLKQEEAVLVACRRYEAQRPEKGYEEAIRALLAHSKLEVRTRIAVWTLRASWQLIARVEKALPRLQETGTTVHVLHGSESVTIIADEAAATVLDDVLVPEDLLRHRKGLVQLNVRTPSSVEGVQGMLAFLTGSLAARGINFLEVISCHKDNMFVIEEPDLFASFEIVNGLLQGTAALPAATPRRS